MLDVLPGFAEAFEIVVATEGGYSQDPADPGNWTGGAITVGQLKGTKFGISAKAYPDLDIENLTLGMASDIYLRDYWTQANCDALPWALALVIFDSAVNSGVRTAVNWLQWAVGVEQDGMVGPVTLAALAEADIWKVTADVLTARLLYDIRLPGWKTFGPGWAKRISYLPFQAQGLIGKLL